MKISRASRRFHDPWGGKHGNRRGSVCRFQFMVGKNELDNPEYYGETGPEIDGWHYYFDFPAMQERNTNRYIRSGKRGVEKIRR